MFVIYFRNKQILKQTMAQHPHHHHHHGSLSTTTSGSSMMMVRKHRTMQRQRKYQQRVISWWIKLSVPPMALLLIIYYFGTSRFLVRDNHNREDDSDDNSNKQKKNKKSSTDSIAIWMQNSDAKSCRSEILDRSDGHWPLSFLLANGGGGRDEAETVLRQSLVCFSPPVSTTSTDNNNNNNNNGIVTTASTTSSSTMVRSVWIAGSTAAAGYGNRKHQSYPALVLASLSSTKASGTVSVDVGRDMTEFPLAWCRGTTSSTTSHHSHRRMVLYDFQDDLQHFNITRLRDFVTYVQPTVLMVRLSNDHDVDSQRDIVQYLQSLVQEPEPQQQQRQGKRSSSNSTTLATTTTFATTKSVRAVYIIDVSSVVVATTTNDNEKQMGHDGGDGGNGGTVFGVANSPDSLHAHHLTLAQHERVAMIVQLLMRHHGFYDDDVTTAAVPDPDNVGKEEEEEDAAADGTNSAEPNTNHRLWHCASGFGDAMTTGRTPGTLHFVDDEPSSSSSSSITLPTVLPDCCGNSLDSVLLPNQDLRHLHWMWDALDASAKRRDLPFDQYGHTDWKIVVSGTPHSNALKVVLPVPSSASENGGGAAVRQVRVCCADCDGMIISSSSSSAVDSTLQSVGYGCFDVHPPSATSSISVPSGTCQISHILWQ
jgi:hypothetical protein